MQDKDDTRELLVAEIERRAAELDATLDSMVDGLSITATDGRVLRMNAAAERMFGMTIEELNSSIPERLSQLGMTKPDGTPMSPEESPTYRVAHGETVSGLVEVMHLKDRTLWLSVNAAPILARDGTCLGVVTTFTDITARVQADEVLRSAYDQLDAMVQDRTAELGDALNALGKERKRFFDVLETLPVMICLLTPDHHVPFANRAFRQKFGDPEGRHCYDSCFGKKEPCDFCESYKVLETGKPHHWEVTTPDGEMIVSVFAFPFTDIDGSPLILEMDLDVTEQRRAEEELRAHRDRLEEMVKERTSQLEAEMAERIRAEQAVIEAEERKIEFYRRTLMAATGGKLVSTDRQEIERIVGPAVATWEIGKPADLRIIRSEVGKAATDAGMAPVSVDRFAVCVGEAATNAIKYAAGGVASIHRIGEGLAVVISDTGRGIHDLSLPDVALTPGYHRGPGSSLGMGYKIMIQYADRVYLATGPGGTTVAIEMKLHPEPEPDGLEGLAHNRLPLIGDA